MQAKACYSGKHRFTCPAERSALWIDGDNIGDQDLRFREVFRASRFEDLSLSEWLAHTPPEPVMARLNINQGTYDTIPKEKLVVVAHGVRFLSVRGIRCC